MEGKKTADGGNPDQKGVCKNGYGECEVELEEIYYLKRRVPL